ncbi:MAG TPA: amidohydrolase/deacetylase family metallohydrolase [Candidatus Limnocylindrales bacterium]|nr:amidohydrolase/deacetylase family metallohydrolase [Candidatus Limnocylindrales bacterium]
MTRYDLVLSGGTVIDPASGLHDRRDVGIADGRIAAIGPHLSGSDAADVLDVAGLLVVPGLVDLHAHVYPGVADLSVEADPTCLGRGVTTVVDAGSSGANTFPGFRRWVVEPSRGRVLAYLNISLTGQIDPFYGELHDLRFADPERAAAVAIANDDVIVGFKVRLSQMLAGPNGIAGLERALEAGRAAGLPVMAHIGGTAFGIEEVFARFRPGDIITHAYTGWRPGALVTDGGRVVPGALEARARGIMFDVGHGAGSFTWEVAEAALADGFRPDTISSDLHRFNVAGPVHDLATTLSKLLLLGIPLDDVIGMGTVAPATALGAAGAGLGRLVVGAEADVTVLALEEGRTRLVDSAGIAREADRRLVPVAVLRAGRRAPIEPLATEPPRGITPG